MGKERWGNYDMVESSRHHTSTGTETTRCRHITPYPTGAQKAPHCSDCLVESLPMRIGMGISTRGHGNLSSNSRVEIPPKKDMALTKSFVKNVFEM
jgi:hypothetical protein